MNPTKTEIDPAAVKRVLIYRLGSLGDTVVALPSLHLVRRTFPSARTYLLSNIPVHAKAPAAAAILGSSGLVDGYLDYPVGTRSVRHLIRLWWAIRRFRPQVLIYLMKSRGTGTVQRDAKFFRLCGIPHIVGLPVGDLEDSIFDPITGRWEREASRLLRCLRPLGSLDVNDLSGWDLHLTERELHRGREAIAALGGRPFIACGPGTKMQAKDWGKENWRALLERMTEKWPEHGLILIGAKEDTSTSEYVSGAWRGPAVNLCGHLTPRETAAVLRHAELFIGPDSGPMHLAAAYGVPCAIAFAALDRPGRWYPIGERHQSIYHHVECANCRLTECFKQKKKCLLSITVDEMLQAATTAWEEMTSCQD